MSRFPDLAVFALIFGMAAGSAVAESYGLGREATPEEVAAWDIDIRPDGLGLPDGGGSVADGEEIYVERCAVCHGDFGEAVGRWPVLAGGYETLTSARPVKTIGSYWPYLSTVWDYVHRAMPFGDAQSLSADETYALTAYLLYLNDIVDDEFELTRENFTEVVMPNADGFYADDRTETPVWKNRTPCMKDCKAEVKITARAAVIDVTPDDPTARHPTGEGSEEKAEAAEQPEAEVASAPTPAVDPALVEAGKKVFRKCKACHAVGDGAKHKIGPHLNDIFGRTAGTVDGFGKYSKDMVKAGEEGLVWDEETLAAFLAKPRSVIKRTKMAFAGLKKDAELDAVIAYLKAMPE
ncbi:c-type cytochrome [Nisaea sp.]|uniref:c-type cytochrome n=1 Tax=Nisaea sp. TaxID=2024842 RepID=UPI003B52CFB0